MNDFSLDFELFNSGRRKDKKTNIANVLNTFLQIVFADVPKSGCTYVKVNI
jgi:hypothetical protein